VESVEETEDVGIDDEEGDDDRSDAEKAAHRAIPSWSEAVNVVIAVNMESRTRNPHPRGHSRPRGRGR
jgi:hypothetical protein